MRLTCFLAASLPLCIFLSGCSAAFIGSATPSPQTNIAPLAGKVHGGRQPISGAEIFMFAADQTAYGHASDSLILSDPDATYPSTQDTNASDPTYGDYYLTTDANGGFYFDAGEYSCTAGQQVYLYSLGGDPGDGTNSAAGLLAVLGTCQSDGGFIPYPGASEISYVNMNEISTIAAAYAFSGFATDAVHVSSSNTSLAATGLANAFANASNLFNITSANNTVALATTPAGNGTVPQTTLDTLANILASCINTSGPSSTPCSTLFEDDTNNGIPYGTTGAGTQPTDTATAAINLAHHPYTADVTTIYNIVGSTAVPYEPALTTAPTAFTIALKFTGGGLDLPTAIAIDASGDAWIANPSGNSVTKLSSSGKVLSGNGSGAYTAGGTMHEPSDIAIDASGNVWIANYSGNGVTKLSNSGTVLSDNGNGAYTGGSMNDPRGIAIDGSGNAWIANYGGSSVTELSSSGTVLSDSGNGAYSDGSENAPISIAIDGSGNAWVANYAGNSVTEFSSSGTVVSDSGNGAYTSIHLNYPIGIAVDGSGDAWIVSIVGNSVSELSNSGALISDSGNGAYTSGGFSNPYAIAIDGSGNSWIPNEGSDTVTELSSSGTALSGNDAYTGGGLDSPTSIAIDGSGNAWISNFANNSVTEFIGVATPVITPICAGLPSTPTANGSSNLGTKP